MKSSLFDSLVVFIILVKLIVFIFSALHIYDIVDHKDAEWALYWKERFEFVFIVSMSLLCMLLFNPFYKGALVVDHAVRKLFFLYGVLILITCNWNTFFKLPPWLITIQGFFKLDIR
jgi:hypothetical protein